MRKLMINRTISFNKLKDRVIISDSISDLKLKNIFDMWTQFVKNANQRLHSITNCLQRF